MPAANWRLEGADLRSFDWPCVLTCADRPDRRHHNAWRHDKEQALWAAFALKFVRDLSQQIKWPRRVAAKFSLRWRRYNWEEGWIQFVLSALAIFLFTCVSGSLLLYFRRHGFGEVADIAGKEGEPHLIRVLYLTGGAGYIVLGVYALELVTKP